MFLQPDVSSSTAVAIEYTWTGTTLEIGKNVWGMKWSLITLDWLDEEFIRPLYASPSLGPLVMAEVEKCFQSYCNQLQSASRLLKVHVKMPFLEADPHRNSYLVGFVVALEVVF